MRKGSVLFDAGLEVSMVWILGLELFISHPHMQAAISIGHARSWHVVKHHQDVLAWMSHRHSVNSKSTNAAGPQFKQLTPSCLDPGQCLVWMDCNEPDAHGAYSVPRVTLFSLYWVLLILQTSNSSKLISIIVRRWSDLAVRCAGHAKDSRRLLGSGTGVRFKHNQGRPEVICQQPQGCRAALEGRS